MEDPSHHHVLEHRSAKNSLLLAVSVTLLFGIVEAVTGWLAGSLTLMSDAGHMGADAIGLAIAAFASWIANKPTSKKHTYGFGRAEVIAAWLSSLILIVVIFSIFVEAIDRFSHPKTIQGGMVMVVAFLGLVINVLVAWILSHGEKTINIRAALLHVFSDLLGSVVVLLCGTIIIFTGWSKADPIFSIVICILILISTVKLLRESLLVLMEAVPINVNVSEVQAEMTKIPGVAAVHDLHIWTLTSGITLLTAHLVLNDSNRWPEIIDEQREMLINKFAINHIALQPETIQQATSSLYHEESNQKGQ